MFWYCFMLLLVQISGQTNTKLKTYSANSLSQEDIFGNVALVIDKILNGLTRNLSVHESDSCITHTVKSFEGIYRFVISSQPFGHCSYCCSIANIANHVSLYLTSKEKRGKFTRLKALKVPGSFKAAGFRKDLLTIFIIHGFTESAEGLSSKRILEAYLNRPEDYNIILVDWKSLSAGPWYFQAANNTKIVGNTLANILKFYNKTGELDLSNVHLIGFSLGAHISGLVGKRFKGRRKIGRITGLDPAFPLFSLKDTSQRLSKLDAKFVDVIHTNAGMFGFPISVGHADFYPNGGGIFQPECTLSNLVENRLAYTIGFCSHYLAFEFYAQSVRNPKVFPARECESISKGYFKNCSVVADGYMGFLANKSCLGSFYVNTSEEWFLRSFREEKAQTDIIN